MAYDRSSINKFVQNQGGSLSNLGASPTYTGAAKPSPGPQFQGWAVTPQKTTEGFQWANDYIRQFGNGNQAQNQTPQAGPGRPLDRFSPGGPAGGYQGNPTPQFQTNPVGSVDRAEYGLPPLNRGPIDPRSEFQANPRLNPIVPPQFQTNGTTLGSLGQPSQQSQYQNAIRNAVMQQRIQMMMKQRGMGNLNRLGVR